MTVKMIKCSREKACQVHQIETMNHQGLMIKFYLTQMRTVYGTILVLFHVPHTKKFGQYRLL